MMKCFVLFKCIRSTYLPTYRKVLLKFSLRGSLFKVSLKYCSSSQSIGICFKPVQVKISASAFQLKSRTMLEYYFASVKPL